MLHIFDVFVSQQASAKVLYDRGRWIGSAAKITAAAWNMLTMKRTAQEM